MLKHALKKILKKALKEIGISKKEVSLVSSQNPNFGDYSTNLALEIGREKNLSPKKIAQSIQLSLLRSNPFLFEKIEIGGEGFLNFFLSQNVWHKILKEILTKKEDFGRVNLGRGKKVQVEFISANPTGPLTVGNARGGPVGDTLANVLKKAGYQVEKAYYINDYGRQILELGRSVLNQKNAHYKGEYIKEISKRIKEKDPMKAGERAAKIILQEMIKPTVKKLGIKYDEWFSEKKLHLSGEVDKVLEILKRKNLIYQKDKALWFKSSQFNDKRDRVLVKSDGSKTYLAGDIAYHRYKFEVKKFDKVINIWGADHYDDAPGLKAGVKALGCKGELHFLFLQFVTIIEKGKKKKMSKREGIYVSMDEVLNEVGKDAVRFFFLEKSPFSHLSFDLDLAKEASEKNPVYYIQYAHARISSILKKRKLKNKLQKFSLSDFKVLTHPSEISLIKKLNLYPEIIEEISRDYQVQRLPRYALEVARAFHQFYHDCYVLTSDIPLQKARLGLVFATKIILKDLLSLMGISAPSVM